MRRSSLLVAALLTLPARAGVGTAADQGVPSKDGMVVCTSAPACDAGAAILARGGNAVDAAVATAFALAVTHPSAGNIGGGGFMMVRSSDGKLTSFDYREKAPAASTRTMYLRDGKVDITLTNEGYLAPGVPGTVRGLALAHKRFGKLAWKEVVMPAVDLAEGGFTLSAALARSLNGQLFPTERNGVPSGGVMAKYPASVAAYGKPDGGQWAAGDRIVLGDLAKTLRAIATEGPDVFYKGWIADRTAEDMAAHGGLITKQDLAAYEAKERAPVTGSFRGYDIAAMPPPSSGGVAMIEMLNILEGYDLKSKGAASAEAKHLEIEAMRRAYLDRARFLGDPDFVPIPVATLLSKPHAKEVAASIDVAKASSSAALGQDILTLAQPAEPDETTHFSIVDRRGMAVSNTFTLEGGFGSRVVVKGAGFLLNNEMGDFNAGPGLTDEKGLIGTEPNLAQPGKRMLSSMTPAILAKDGDLFMVIGSPGGRTIINTVLLTILNVVDFGMNIQDAVDFPRFHHQWLPDRIDFEKNGISPDTLALLKQRGHATEESSFSQGVAQGIVWNKAERVLEGATDRRVLDGAAIGR
jgi:gamma-glutamyltranspeptidase/glutathione hydrolase